MMLENALYIVPTPIGNLSDITLRAVEVLKEATLIAAEDTRHSKILLDSLNIHGKKMLSCHDHNEQERVQKIIDEVRNGGSVALISDAGTPLINDPGYKLVTICVKENVMVIPLPGPCALITALEGSGLPTDKFMFMGFFPVKERELEESLKRLEHADYTAVFYESPRRITSTVAQIAAILPERKIAICRELTKTFESFYRLKASEAPAFLAASPDRIKGEFVVIIGSSENDQQDTVIDSKLTSALIELTKTAPLKQVVGVLSELCGVKKNTLYEYALKIKNRAEE